MILIIDVNANPSYVVFLFHRNSALQNSIAKTAALQIAAATPMI